MADDEPVGRSELIQGLLFDHTRINLNTIEIHTALSKVEALVETLTDAGILDARVFQQKWETVAERLRERFVEKGMAVAVQEHDTGKYEMEGLPEIDCESRLPLCGAACCRLQFALSKEDVEEGIVRWKLGHPYFIAQTSDRYCVHLDPESRRCGVYQQRPIPCRAYDCSRDKRVWEDFDARIPNPRLKDPDWPHGLTPQEEGSSGGADR